MKIQLNQELTEFVNTAVSMIEGVCEIAGFACEHKAVEKQVENLFHGSVILMSVSAGATFLKRAYDGRGYRKLEAAVGIGLVGFAIIHTYLVIR